MQSQNFTADFIPSRHGIQRERTRDMLGILRLLIPGSAEPSAERWQAIGAGLMQGDEPMDRLVEWMFSVGMKTARPLFEQALERGIESLPDAPEPLRAFFALVDRRPDWLDEKLLAEGIRANQVAGVDAAYIQRDIGLMGGYQASGFNQTLLITGALEKGPARRFAETFRWYLDTNTDGGMDRYGAGFKSTLRVRLIHGMVRRHVRRLPQWRMAEWGLPVNQTDMAATLMVGVLQLMALRLLGVPVTPREGQAVMHHLRYLGWVMGVEERWLPHDEASGRQLLYQLLLSITNPDGDTIKLAHALMDEPLQRRYRNFEELRGRIERSRHLSVTRFFFGRATIRNLGLPENVLPWFPLLRAPTNVARHLRARLTPGGRQQLARQGRQEQEAFIRRLVGESPAVVGAAAQHISHPVRQAA